MRSDNLSLTTSRLVVAFIGINQPGYQTIANAYLREAVKADSRLPEVWALNLDFNVEQDVWWMCYQILGLNPRLDVVSFAVYCWNAGQVFALSQMLAKLAPEIKLIAGGPEVGPIACETLTAHPEFCAVIEGEGERSVPDVLLSIAREGSPYGIPGVAALSSHGVAMMPAKPVDPLDTVRPPYTDKHLPALDGAAYLETYRGCPHSCAYCFEAKGSKRIRAFSWERVKKDVERVASTPGLTSFTFIDSVFNLTLPRLEKLAEILEPWARRGIRLHTIEVDIESVDAHQADLLKRCGVASVETGPQTTNLRALELCQRSLDKEKFLSGVQALREVGIAVEADLIIGLPGDTQRDVLASMRFALNSGATRVQMSTLHVLPGTPLWERADELGLIYDESAPHDIMATNEMSYRELRRVEVFGSALSKLIDARI